MCSVAMIRPYGAGAALPIPTSWGSGPVTCDCAHLRWRCADLTVDAPEADPPFGVLRRLRLGADRSRDGRGIVTAGGCAVPAGAAASDPAQVPDRRQPLD